MSTSSNQQQQQQPISLDERMDQELELILRHFNAEDRHLAVEAMRQAVIEGTILGSRIYPRTNFGLYARPCGCLIGHAARAVIQDGAFAHYKAMVSGRPEEEVAATFSQLADAFERPEDAEAYRDETGVDFADKVADDCREIAEADLPFFTRDDAPAGYFDSSWILALEGLVYVVRPGQTSATSPALARAQAVLDRWRAAHPLPEA